MRTHCIRCGDPLERGQECACRLCELVLEDESEEEALGELNEKTFDEASFDSWWEEFWGINRRNVNSTTIKAVAREAWWAGRRALERER